MFYFKTYSFPLFLILFEDIFGHLRRWDETLCVRGNSSSCNHQLEQEVRAVTNCEVEYIYPKDCPDYSVHHVFEPEKLPFNLLVYNPVIPKIEARSVSPYISFPHPSWNSMRFYLKNKYNPDIKLCRRFKLVRDAPVNISSLFWNCLLFTVSGIEDNYFSLALSDDKNSGGVYSFRVPSLKNYDLESPKIASWHVFFFIHEQYLEVTGKLVVSIQRAPFSNISYSVTLLKCLNQNLRCKEDEKLHNIFFNQEKYLEMTASPFTFEVAEITEPQTYAVTVQILSPLCPQEECEVSFSPTFEILKSYTIELTVILFVTTLIVCLFTFFLGRELHLRFHRYIEKESGKMRSVLFVYHVDSTEDFLFVKFLARLFLEKFHIQPLLVDEDAGTEDPHEWTRHQLWHSSRIVFIVPRSLARKSVTPIQGQWRCALRHFSGPFLKAHRNVDSRCASIILDTSMTLYKGHQISTLNTFCLGRNLPWLRLVTHLASLGDWFHRNSLLDRFLFWRPVARQVSQDLSAFAQFVVDLNTRKPQQLFDVETSDEMRVAINVHTTKADSRSIDAERVCETQNDERDGKIREEFDGLIPDIGCVRFEEQDSDEDSTPSHSGDEMELSDGSGSINDVFNFAI